MISRCSSVNIFVSWYKNSGTDVLDTICATASSVIAFWDVGAEGGGTLEGAGVGTGWTVF